MDTVDQSDETPIQPSTPEGTVDVFDVLDDLANKIHIISQYCGLLLSKINELYVRLDIASTVIDAVATSDRDVHEGVAKGMTEDEYLKIVQDSVVKVNESLDASGMKLRGITPPTSQATTPDSE